MRRDRKWNDEAARKAMLDLFTVLAAFTVIAVVLRATDIEDISGLAGLNQRSPLLAAAIMRSAAPKLRMRSSSKLRKNLLSPGSP